MKLVWSSEAWSDYVALQASDAAFVARINDLLKDAARSPFRGLGKPEPLRRNLAGWWSRRITQEHRLVYRMTGAGDQQQLEILSCRFHY